MTSRIGETFTWEGKGTRWVYLGVRRRRGRPHHVFYDADRGFEYSVRGRETAKRHFPDWDGEDLLNDEREQGEE